MLKPSYSVILKTINENKLKIFFIIVFDLIQAICEGAILATTYYLFEIFQNGEIISINSEIPFSNIILKILNTNQIIIIPLLILLISLTFIQSTSKYLGQINIQRLGAWLKDRINKQIANIVLESNYEKIAYLRTGKLLTITMECPEVLRYQLEILACSILGIMYLILYAKLLINLSFREFIISLSALLVIASIQILMYKKVKNTAIIANESRAKVNNSLTEIIKGVKYLRSSGSEEFANKRLSSKSAELSENLIKSSIFYELTEPLGKLSGVIVLSLIILLFTNNLNQNSALLATTGIFILALQRLIGKINELGQLNNNFTQNKGKMKLYDDLITEFREVKKNNLQKEKNNNKNDYLVKSEKINQIELKNLYFRYQRSNRNILNNINFIARKGDLIGIAGRSGSGKSTLLNIISGLIKETKGDYYINNKKNLISNKFAKNKISIVNQESYIIPGSIYENIKWDNKDNKKRAYDCLKKIDGINFLESLPRGIETIIGEGGLTISGGQTQLVCIARALFKDSDIVILDEATSSLDKKSEQKIMGIIKALSKKKIIIFISHNLENMIFCNNIYFLNKGQITDEGTFDKLLEKNSLFKKIKLIKS